METKENLFRKKSLDRVSSPDRLDEIIHVANPSIWVILTAIVILLAAVLVWSIWGELPTTRTAAGVAENGIVTLYLTMGDADKVLEGMAARVGQAEGKITAVGELPLSKSEVAGQLNSDYLLQTMELADWSLPVTAQITGVPDGPCTVTVTVDTINPIRFILN